MSDRVQTRVHPAYRVFVSYIDKSREYYAAHGYERPYRWSHNDESPFTALVKPLGETERSTSFGQRRHHQTPPR